MEIETLRKLAANLSKEAEMRIGQGNTYRTESFYLSAAMVLGSLAQALRTTANELEDGK